MDELPGLDDDAVHQELRRQQAVREAKNIRISTGGSTREDRAGESCLGERETRWGFTTDELQAAQKVVSRLFSHPELLVGDPILAETRIHLFITRPKEIKRKNFETYKKIVRETVQRDQLHDAAAVQTTAMKKERDAAATKLLQLAAAACRAPHSSSQGTEPSDHDGPQPRLKRPRMCYVCKAKYTELHHYYYALCPACAALNYSKRLQRRDLTGKVVLLTGCRIKIGYEMALSLLRCGATLIGTTRFVADARMRFEQEADATLWKDRLLLYPLDLRDLRMVERFARHIARHFPTLFALINNAAQTIARLPSYTERLRTQERLAVLDPPPPAVNHSDVGGQSEWQRLFLADSSVVVGRSLAFDAPPSELFLAPSKSVEPTAQIEDEALRNSTTVRVAEAAHRMLVEGGELSCRLSSFDRYDTLFEASDLRAVNSWTMTLGQVGGGEAAEVMMINAIAPFILVAGLRAALANRGAGTDQSEKRFVINVSAMEGQFKRFKLTTHPHTNMAKAALNMMTRTSGADYARDGIYMNSVDTGWITDETPLPKRASRAEKELLCPIDEVDAAARCLDLIYLDSAEHSQFWKDYRPTAW